MACSETGTLVTQRARAPGHGLDTPRTMVEQDLEVGGYSDRHRTPGAPSLSNQPGAKAPSRLAYIQTLQQVI